jgi:hypothetical protein
MGWPICAAERNSTMGEKMTIDFGNVVNREQQSAEDRFLHRRPQYKTFAELAYDCRGHQAAQLIYMIGEALKCRQVHVAAELCAEAEEVLAGLRRFCLEGKLN